MLCLGIYTSLCALIPVTLLKAVFILHCLQEYLYGFHVWTFPLSNYSSINDHANTTIDTVHKIHKPPQSGQKLKLLTGSGGLHFRICAWSSFQITQVALLFFMKIKTIHYLATYQPCSNMKPLTPCMKIKWVFNSENQESIIDSYNIFSSYGFETEFWGVSLEIYIYIYIFLQHEIAACLGIILSVTMNFENLIFR